MDHFERIEFPFKWVVLDDDPTGVQTVNHVSVYTDWSLESIREGGRETESVLHIDQFPRNDGRRDNQGSP